MCSQIFRAQLAIGKLWNQSSGILKQSKLKNMLKRLTFKMRLPK